MSVNKEVQAAVRELLTDEQRALLPKPKKAGKGKKKAA